MLKLTLLFRTSKSCQLPISQTANLNTLSDDMIDTTYCIYVISNFECFASAALREYLSINQRG